MNPSDIQGWMYVEELNWLQDKALEMNSIVEVGSYKGRSTLAFLYCCSGPVFAIDRWDGAEPVYQCPWNEVYAEFKQNVGHFKNLVVMKMDSVKAAEFFKPKSVDMIFLDADHTETGILTDLKVWRDIPRKLLCGHDLGPGWPMVEVALKESGIPYLHSGVGTIWKWEIK